MTVTDAAKIDWSEPGVHKVPRKNVIWLSGLAIVLVLLVFGVAWTLVGLDGNVWPTIVAVVSSFAAVLVIFAAARKWAWWGERLRPRLVGLTALGCCLVVIGTWTGIIAGLKLGEAERAWLAVAAPLLDESGNCTEIHPAQLPGVGHIEQACNIGNIVVLSQSTGAATGAGSSGIIYAPNDAKMNHLNICVAHLNGPWFHFSPVSAGGGCPFGADFIQGP